MAIILKSVHRIPEGTRINTVEGKKIVTNNCVEFESEKNASDLLRNGGNWILVSGMEPPVFEGEEPQALTVENTKPEELLELGKTLSKNVVIDDSMAGDDQEMGTGDKNASKQPAETAKVLTEDVQGDKNKTEVDKEGSDAKKETTEVKQNEKDGEPKLSGGTKDDDDDSVTEADIEKTIDAMEKNELVKYAKENNIAIEKLPNGTPKYKSLREEVKKYAKEQLK